MATFENPEVVQEELDILLIGGGMACCGAAFELMRWAEAVKAETGRELKIKLVDKAGHEVIPASRISVHRDLTYNDAQLLAKEQEENQLYREMQNDVVLQLLRRLSSAHWPLPAAQ